MGQSVTKMAKGDEVFFRVVAGVTAEFLVVDLQLTHCSAALAPPSIPLEDLPAQLFVGVGS
jgi:hypothetical protein